MDVNQSYRSALSIGFVIVLALGLTAAMAPVCAADVPFHDVGANLQPAVAYAAAWGDYDGNGRADPIVTGRTNITPPNEVTAMYLGPSDRTIRPATAPVGAFVLACGWANTTDVAATSRTPAPKAAWSAGWMRVTRSADPIR